MEKKGLLLIVSGFSGAGKGTIVKEFINRHKDVRLSVSATTRERRQGEQEGVHYYYISKDQFEDMIDNGDMFEYASYVNNYYGTPKSFVMEQLEQGHDVILEIEMQGALQVKRMYDEAILIFVVPPHAKDLEERLFNRGTETAQVIKRRLQRSYEEVDLMGYYDYIIVNDQLPDSVMMLENIRNAEHLKVKHYENLIDNIKKELQSIIN